MGQQTVYYLHIQQHEQSLMFLVFWLIQIQYFHSLLIHWFALHQPPSEISASLTLASYVRCSLCCLLFGTTQEASNIDTENSCLLCVNCVYLLFFFTCTQLFSTLSFSWPCSKDLCLTSQGVGRALSYTLYINMADLTPKASWVQWTQYF